MKIKVDDLCGVEIRRLLGEHLTEMKQNSPPESMHALSVGELVSPSITVWSAWEDNELLGCGALRELDPKHGEIKSMRTSSTHRVKGVATEVLRCIIREARRRHYKKISLETGSAELFLPAQRLYEKFGFKKCGPFGDYVEDPNSLYMTLDL